VDKKLVLGKEDKYAGQYERGYSVSNSLGSVNINVDEIVSNAKKNILKETGIVNYQRPDSVLYSRGGTEEDQYSVGWQTTKPLQVEEAVRYNQDQYNVTWQQGNSIKQQQPYVLEEYNSNNKFDMLVSAQRPGQTLKSVKGKIVTETFSVFEDFRTMVGDNEFADLVGFKLACLKPKALLYENDSIQIGITSNVQLNEKTRKNNSKITLYYGNIGYNPVTNFAVRNDQEKNLFIEVLEQPENSITPGKQTKQTFLTVMKGVPIGPVQVTGSYFFENQNTKISFLLPTTINKFMEFKPIDSEESFRMRWSFRKATALRTEEIELDPSIIGNSHDFKKYFSYLIDLKPKNEYDYVQGKNSIKFAGVFDLDVPNYEYMLKIVALPNNKVIFQIVCFEENEGTAKFILRTLAFLFGL